jgi:PAS domain S-box-containing protein
MNPPLRVLHLEDDPKDTKLVQAALEKEGIGSDLTRFEKEEDFVIAVKSGNFDLILADYTLPSFDGFSALKIVLQYSPDLPFIFVSGTLGEEVAIEALKTGATDYVLKTRLARLGPAVERAMREAREKADRKRAEQALRQSEKELRNVIESIPAMVWSALPDASNVSMNKRWVEYTGSFAAGAGWQAAVHADDLARHMDAFRMASAKGLPFEDEIRIRRSDGEYHWFFAVGTPLRDEHGKILKWYGILTDIQERKRAEEALRLSEHLARGQLEALQQALVSLSRDSEPEKFFQHVLCIVCQQLGAHSISLWKVNDKVSGLELAAIFEDDRLRLPTREETQPLPLDPECKEDSVWGDFFRTGKRCVYSVIDESDVNPLKVREVMSPNGPWHIGLWSAAASVNIKKTVESLFTLGVRSTLTVPMIFSGKVTGLFNIRFTQKREFRQEEIELTRAMTQQAMLAMQLMRLSRQSRETAVIAERNRVARDLHDTLLQGFTGIGMKLEAMASSLPPSLATTREQLQKILEQSDEYLSDARRSVWGLRSPSLAELGDFPAALKKACERALQDANIALRFTTHGAERKLTPGIEDNLLRICEEAVTNAVKHADPTEVEVALEYTAKELQLQIRDNGRGFDPHSPNGSKNGHFGLVGIRERTKVLAGNLSLDSQPGGGTEIVVTVCLPPES